MSVVFMLYARFSVSADAAAFCRRCVALIIIVFVASRPPTRLDAKICGQRRFYFDL